MESLRDAKRPAPAMPDSKIPKHPKHSFKMDFNNINPQAFAEYNNFGELMGLDLEANEAELSAKLSRLPTVKRLQFMKKIMPPHIPSRGSRAEMEKHFGSLPEETRRLLRIGKMRLGDSLIYSVKPVNGTKTVKMFEPQDDKNVGFSNIANAKLPKNEALLVSGIYLLVGIVQAANPASPTPDEIKATRFVDVDTVPAIANGEWSFAVNSVQYVKNSSNRVFVTGSNTTRDMGYYKLDNPRPLEPDTEIEFTVELPTTLNIPANAYIYVGLDGTKPHS